MTKLKYNKPKNYIGSEKNIEGLKPTLKSSETGLFIDRPIQVYRCWFEYLKLCLELEDLGLSLEKYGKVKLDRPRLTGGRRGGERVSPNPFEWKIYKWKIKVDRDRYEVWDLDKVLTQSFDKSWKPHRHLFENQKTIEIKSPQKWVQKPHYRYIRVDTRKRYEDTRNEIEEILSDLKGEKRKELKTSTSQFPVIGKPRVDTLVVNRNIMIRFKNWKLDNGGKNRKQIESEILQKESARIGGLNQSITRRLRDTYPVMIGICHGEFMKSVKLEEVGELV